MIVTRFDHEESPWVARVDLTEHEWPPAEDFRQYLKRPMFMWVHANCDKAVFSARERWILFSNQEDLLQFTLTWY